MEEISTNLGKLIYTISSKYVCEFGILDKKTSILWKEINELFLDGQRTSINYIPTGESIEINVVSITGGNIRLKQNALFRMGSKKKGSILGIYNFIVNRIIDRQMSELVTAIKNGNRISFNSFDITSNSLYRKKFFGGHDIIEFDRITGCDFYNGEFVIEFIDNNGCLKQKSSGHVADIPNIHLAQALLLSIAKSNLETRRGSIRESFKK